MNPFAALDEVLNSGALTPVAPREISPLAKGDFQPLFAPGAWSPGQKGCSADAGALAPQVEVIEENGRITQIVVTCRCGERTVLDCAY